MQAPHANHPPVARVLIVDDDELVSRMFSMILQAAGYEVIVAGSGENAWNVINQQTFDAILLDLGLPHMNGSTLLSKLRENSHDTPVVTITGNPNDDEILQCMEEGAFRCLQKPVGAHELRSVVKQAIQFGRVQQQRISQTKLTVAAAVEMPPTSLRDQISQQREFEHILQEMFLVYQPIINIPSDRIIAYEALFRSKSTYFKHPGHFFGIVEQLGKSAEVGRIVRRRVAQDIPLFPDNQAIFVNIHVDELTDEDLLIGPLSQHAHRVVLEVTERAALRRGDSILSRVEELRKSGYRIAIDDLGEGYAALNNLIHLRSEVVKLDMSLVRKINSDPVRQSLVKSLVTFGKEIDTTIVCEGVETLEEAATLKMLGADVHQGFFYAKPSFPPPEWPVKKA